VEIDKIRKNFVITELQIQKALLELDKLNLIRLETNDRYKVLVNQSIYWALDGPITEKYGKETRTDFMDSSFLGPCEKVWLVSGSLSQSSLGYMGKKLDLIAKEFRELIDYDRNLTSDM